MDVASSRSRCDWANSEGLKPWLDGHVHPGFDSFSLYLAENRKAGTEVDYLVVSPIQAA
jgi:hypothetical protein